MAVSDPRNGAHLEASTSDDSMAFVQQGVRARVNKHNASSSSTVHASQTNDTESPLMVPPELYCKLFPKLCQPPFDCHTITNEERDMWNREGRAFDGKPNLRSWCFDPQFMPMMSRCAAGDLSGAGMLQYDLTRAGLFGPTTMELDGSYCFMEGHCVNEAVTNDTTLEEAAQMCDERFGHEAWTRVGRDSAPPEDVIGFAMDEIDDRRNGFTSRNQTRPYLMMACAMGNFHCDVMYCRENYCKNPHYVNKYGHMLKTYGWAK